MSEYNAYGELYDQRPELLIHERLRHSGLVRELASLAAEQNFHVSFEKGPFRQDMMIKWNDTPDRKYESHTVSSGLKYFQRLKSVRG